MNLNVCKPVPILRDLNVTKCETARDFIQEMGSTIPVTKANLERAVALVRPASVVQFCNRWLDWEPPMFMLMRQYVDRVMYPASRKSRFCRLSHEERTQVARTILVAAIWAYIEEMRRP